MQTSDSPAAVAPARRSALGSFAQFVLFGGGVGLASSAAVPLVATVMPWVAANALITIASTVLGTELHARFTFGTGRRARWQQHVQSAGSAAAAYLVTSAAILVLHVVQPSASMAWEQAVYLGASGLAGTGRFVVLRLYVFARGGPQSSRRLPVPDRQRPRETVAEQTPARAADLLALAGRGGGRSLAHALAGTPGRGLLAATGGDIPGPVPVHR